MFVSTTWGRRDKLWVFLKQTNSRIVCMLPLDGGILGQSLKPAHLQGVDGTLLFVEIPSNLGGRKSKNKSSDQLFLLRARV